ncbi:unnamed protein product [Bursaphelenchus xylophilus]|nr:unnamed protein product [Bursaphelenchus xylophilus]CAG9131398.1 unnamed protein product [Bursaphelenchus xylophilus]
MDPVLAQIYREHPNTACFSGGVDSLIVTIATCYIFVAVAFGAFFLGFIYITINRSKFTANTYRLQMMLFWSLIAQMAAFVVFMLIPGTVYLGGATLKFRNLPKISVICFFFFVSHTTVDSLMVLFFIKPYRRAVFYNVKRIFASSQFVDRTSMSVSEREIVKENTLTRVRPAVSRKD